MTDINVDFDSKSSADIPAGEYVASIEGIEEVDGQTATQLKVKLRITKGNYEGYELTDWISMSDAAVWRMTQFVRAVGISGEGKQNIDTELLQGKKIKIRVGFKEAPDGNEYLRVNRYINLEDAKSTSGGGTTSSKVSV